MIPNQTDQLIGSRVVVRSTLPKSSAATEKMVVYGKPGRLLANGSYRLSGNLAGKTLVLTDTSATTTTKKTFTFTRSMFANPEVPLLSEVVTALNAFLDDDATPTVASAGAFGELVLTAAAAAADKALTIGAGTANEDLGFPVDGVTVLVDNNAHLVSVVLPATWNAEVIYALAPRVTVNAFTPSTGAQAPTTTFTVAWTPANRTLNVLDSSNGARAAVIVIDF